jgi:hypothetical protein
MPVLIDGEVAGAVGIAGRSKESDTEIAKETAATVSSAAKAAVRADIFETAAHTCNGGTRAPHYAGV